MTDTYHSPRTIAACPQCGNRRQINPHRANQSPLCRTCLQCNAQAEALEGDPPVIEWYRPRGSLTLRALVRYDPQPDTTQRRESAA